MRITNPMNEREYLSESEKTVSDSYFPNYVSDAQLKFVFEDSKWPVLHADKVKKALFYGKSVPLPRWKINDSFKENHELKNVLHAILGIYTEAGELLEHLHDVLCGKKELDPVNILEELGDLNWYEAMLHREMNTTFSQAWDKNIQKLKLRYGDKFTTDRAINRDLDSERKLLEE
jgi:NTP pyrophosphatase (non-canonical NTP hydrolase)